MIPVRIQPFQNDFPILNEVTDWQLLRKWALSEVYRVTLPNGGTMIIKWGGEEMAREASIYTNLLALLGVRTPNLYGYMSSEQGGLMLLEDVGEYNLEQQPQPEHFMEAARELARIRSITSSNISRECLLKSTIDNQEVSAEHFMRQLHDLLLIEKLDQHPVLMRLVDALPRHLKELYMVEPLTIVHHDYHAKNLMIQGDRILPIDWSNAYLSPHLGDLYSLITEAHGYAGVPEWSIMEAYLAEMLALHPGSNLTLNQVHWQVTVGGICWLIRTLRWLVYGGTHTIPGSEAWIPDLLDDLNSLSQRL